MLQITDDLSSANNIEGVMETLCIFEVTVSQNFSQNNLVKDNETGLLVPEEAEALKEMVCPNQCSGQGNCTQGICSCDNGNALKFSGK